MQPAENNRNRLRTILYSIAALITLVGLFETTYLTALHLAGANVVCIASGTCSEVLHSSYASIRGVPLAGLGSVTYFAAFSCAVLAAFNYRRAPELLVVITGMMFGTTIWLLYVQARILHAFCDYCLFSAALVFLLAGIVIAVPKSSAA